MAPLFETMMKKGQALLLVSFITLGIGSGAAFVWLLPKHTWRAVSYDGVGGGGFPAEKNILGCSMKTWQSPNGAKVEEYTLTYSTEEYARKDFEEKLKDDGTIVEHKRGNRIVKLVDNRESKREVAYIFTLQNRDVNVIAAESLELALAFDSAWVKLEWW